VYEMSSNLKFLFKDIFLKIFISGGAESVWRGNDGAENVRRGSCTGAVVIVRK